MATMDESDESVVARYLVTKISWRGSYRRILTISSACLATYNPETFQCTNQWHLSEIEDVDVLQDRGQVTHSHAGRTVVFTQSIHSSVGC